MVARQVWLTFSIAIVFLGCGGGESPKTGTGGSAGGSCVPGSTQACFGPGACRGGQQCLPDRSGWGPCDCGAAGNSGSGGRIGSGDARSTGGPGAPGGSACVSGSGGRHLF